MKFILLVCVSSFWFLLVNIEVKAEAWIANRYAQNCASCHAPSRRNLPMKDRRCTLACQGCHVNPNGGGIRNQYGIWNQQRWLRSLHTEKLSKWMRKKGLPAPLRKQKYGRQPKKISKSQAKKRKKYLTKGSETVVIHTAEYKETDYDRSDKQEHITVDSIAEFLERVTEDDPLREERRKFIYGGGDFRYFYLSEFGPDKKSTLFPMAFDVGMRVRPTEKYFSFVFENRFRNSPTQEGLDQQFENSQVKSAYIMFDDLPFATYVMYGIYRPLFGHYTADHESLTQRLIEFDYNTVNHALSFGGSPNVPFANIHVIMPSTGTLNKDSGFALNLGGRWVTMGASLTLSYWDTKNKLTGMNRKMYSVNIGGKWDIPGTKKFLVLNSDFTNYDIEAPDGSEVRRDKGVSFTNEIKLNLWRENYLVFNYANANTAASRREGKSSEYMVGVKSFLVSGTELEILSIHREDYVKSTDTSTKADIIQAQVHVFF